MPADRWPSIAVVAAAVLVTVAAFPLAGATVSTSDGSHAALSSQSDSGSGSGSGSSAGSASSSDAASGSGSASQADDERNVTRVFVEPRHERLELKPGETETVNVTVVNQDDTEVELSPSVVQPRRARYHLQSDWVSVDLPTETLGPDEEVEATVTVEVPSDAELGDYRGTLAFTDETIQYGERPPRHVHAMDLGVEVFEEPTLFVESGRHLRSQVQAGDSYTHEIVVRNTGDEAASLNPEVRTEQRRRHCRGPGCAETLERSWLEVDAPAEVPAGDTATVEVTIQPPEDAARGRYSTELTLGLDDPNRPREDRHWQELDLGFEVWKQPDEPFETSFDVREGDEDVTVRLSADGHRGAENGEPATFDVAFVSPNETVVEAERVTTYDRGHVDLGGRPRDGSADRDYRARGGNREVTYALPVDDPATGAWTLRVMPNSTVQFRYEIVRNAST